MVRRRGPSRPALVVLAAVAVIALASPVVAHVPYLERRDWSPESPFVVTDDAENSKALYAWLDGPRDVDVYVVPVNRFVRFYAQILVPACAELADFAPRLAVVGPGLPNPGASAGLPVTLEDGVGAVVLEDPNPPDRRPVIFEPFGGKSYFESPPFDKRVWDAGGWRLVVWHPVGATGDYVAVIGTEEVFSGLDLLRSAVNVLAIRFDAELHGQCTPVRTG